MSVRNREPEHLDSHRIGVAVVECEGCGQERWYGYGPCRACGRYLPSEPSDDAARPSVSGTEGDGSDG